MRPKTARDRRLWGSGSAVLGSGVWHDRRAKARSPRGLVRCEGGGQRGRRDVGATGHHCSADSTGSSLKTGEMDRRWSMDYKSMIIA